MFKTSEETRKKRKEYREHDYPMKGLLKARKNKCRKCGAKTPNRFYCHNCLEYVFEVPTDCMGWEVTALDLF